jgi:hypothetical protein
MVPWKPNCQFPLALSQNQGGPTKDRRRVTRFGLYKGQLCSMWTPGTEVVGVYSRQRTEGAGKKLCSWVVHVWLGIRRVGQLGEVGKRRKGLWLVGARTGHHRPTRPIEEPNSGLLSWGFPIVFLMGDLLRWKWSFLFMLLGWSLISTAAEDASVMEKNVVSQADTVLCHSWLALIF